MISLRLMDYEKGEGHVYEHDEASPPPFIDHEGRRYFTCPAIGSHFISPANETTLLETAYQLWKTEQQSPSDPNAITIPTAITDYRNELQWVKEHLAELPPLEDYLAHPSNPNAIVLHNDQVGVFESAPYRKFFLEHLLQQIKAMDPAPKRILDFGTGMGQTALCLKQALPEAEIYGFEATAAAAELGRLTAKHYGLEVHFIEEDGLKGFSNFEDNFFDLSLAHSVFCVMALHARSVFEGLRRITGQRIFIYDSMPELWPATPRSWASLYYFQRHSYTSCLTPFATDSQSDGYKLQQAYRLKHAWNPLCEVCFVDFAAN